MSSPSRGSCFLRWCRRQITWAARFALLSPSRSSASSLASSATSLPFSAASSAFRARSRPSRWWPSAPRCPIRSPVRRRRSATTTPTHRSAMSPAATASTSSLASASRGRWPRSTGLARSEAAPRSRAVLPRRTRKQSTWSGRPEWARVGSRSASMATHQATWWKVAVLESAWSLSASARELRLPSSTTGESPTAPSSAGRREAS
mmetsp:Transcript_26206/g.53966  ORF Transcript_26206/g.53966 Transcript_26206/m.53966 type:complete len:205 (+) Transcript_26206:165-779(+)